MDKLNYEIMEEKELVKRAKDRDPAAMEQLLKKYKNLVRWHARSYYLIGADREDLVQEGMIGLYRAICDYDSEKQAGFRGFADLCIRRHIYTAIKSATRQKHRPLNNYVSLNKGVYDEDESERTLLETIVGDESTQNPEDIMIDQESFEIAENRIREMLSERERQALELYLEGKSYQEIAEMLGRSVKSVDNALQRAKAKLEKALNGA